MWHQRRHWEAAHSVANVRKQVHIRKVKLLKQPKFDLGALMTLHGESSTDEQGLKVEREFREQVLESV